MAFTSGNDTNIIQSTDASVVSAGAGNDTYIISSAFIGAGQNVQITDTQGTNTIQLVGGLTIVSSAVTATATQLILSNGATVTLLGANNFTYLVGGDSLTGAGGTTENYETFVTNTLGLASAPTDSTPVSGGSVEVGGGTSGGNTNNLTTDTDALTGTAADESYAGVVSSTSTSTTFSETDSIIDSTTTDNDSLTLTIEADITAANSGVVRGIEKVMVDANATTLTDTNLDFAASNFSKIKEFEFDVVKAATAINGLNVTSVADNGVTVTASDKFSSVSVGGTTGNDLTVDAQAAGTSGSAVTATVTGALDDVTITGAGYLNATSNASTGLLSATANNNLTLSGTAAQVISATSNSGNVTVSDATASVNTTVSAAGNATLDNLAAAGSLNVTAGGTITLDNNSGSLGTTSATLAGVGASSVTTGANALTVATLSGNGGAATYTMTSGTNALADVIVTGDQDVTLKLSAASVETGSAALNIADNSTAGTFTLDLGTAAGNVDLRGSEALVDVLKVSVDNNAKSVSVKSGQEVTYSVDQTATTINVGTAAQEATNTLTVKLDDGTRDAAAADLTGLTINDAKTVTIDASVDTTTAGSAVTHDITTLNASDANSNVTINLGVNNLELQNAGASTVGTGSLIVTGSGTLTDAATVTSLTAGTLDASAMTGAVTLDSTTGLAVGTIKTGSANDTVVLTNNIDTAVEMNAGNDTLTLDGASTVNLATSIDLGEGTDTLKFVAGSELLKGTGTVTLAGVENIEFLASNNTQKIQASLLNGQAYNISASQASSTSNVAVVIDSSDTTVDLSNLVGSVDAASAVAGTTFTLDANANANAVAITGAAGTMNNITGSSAKGDTLTGGNLNDTFNIASDAALFDTTGAMLDTYAGGAQATNGADTLKLTATGAAFEVANTDNWSQVSGIESITTVDNSAAITLNMDVSAGTAGITTIDLSGDTTGAAGANTINVSEYTVATTITGGGTDTVDTITGGSGDDTFVYKLIADINNGGAAVIDSLNGGSGTDTMLVGTSGTAFTLSGTNLSRISNVETIKSASNTAAVSITSNNDSSMWDAGIRTIDISAGSAATGNVIDVSNLDSTVIASSSTTGMTLTGSATGVTTITGTNGIDTMSGGSANDIFNGKGGNDVISLTGGGTDKVVLGEGGYD